ncbi:unnamed protein product [Coregonus sp. 'balchen']|nr:unnamed protein product [Coregonus sp. 'balchen']CAB1312181.1 unnamed protein product [Coregonus sp. 'balchen']
MKHDPKARYRGINLFVKNLDDAFDDHSLRKEFSAFVNNHQCQGGHPGCDRNEWPYRGYQAALAPAQSKAQHQQYLANRYKQRMVSAMALPNPKFNPCQPPIPQGHNIRSWRHRNKT